MRHLYIIILLALTIVSCKKNSTSDPDVKYIYLTNTTEIDRIDESIVISKEKILSILDSIPNNRVPVIKDSSGKIIPFQLDDIEKDGIWDELSLTFNFKSKEIQKLEVTTIAAESIPSFIPKTNIRFGIGTNKNNVKEVLNQKRTGDPRTNDSIFYQMEGPSWENDKVGFRFYFDPRNGIDIFGKTTSELVLDQVGIGDGNYHKLKGWGMDILKVGNSLGAGALAIKHNDSIIRLTGENQTEFNIILEGPIRSIFEMSYKGSKIGDQNIDIVHRITIWKGQFGYHSEVLFGGINDQMKLVSGIVNLKPNKMYLKTLQNHYALETFGKQSENNDLLGMAILVSKKDFITQIEAPKKEGDVDILSTYYMVMNAFNDRPTSFYFLSGWEQSNVQFETYEGFDAMVVEMNERLSNPIQID